MTFRPRLPASRDELPISLLELDHHARTLVRAEGLAEMKIVDAVRADELPWSRMASCMASGMPAFRARRVGTRAAESAKTARRRAIGRERVGARARRSPSGRRARKSSSAILRIGFPRAIGRPRRSGRSRRSCLRRPSAGDAHEFGVDESVVAILWPLIATVGELECGSAPGVPEPPVITASGWAAMIFRTGRSRCVRSGIALVGHYLDLGPCVPLQARCRRGRPRHR